MCTMNRRDFLHLLTATAAAAVAGLRPRPEPTEVGHELLSSAHPDITLTDDGRPGLSTSRDWASFYVGETEYYIPLYGIEEPTSCA